MDVSPAGVHGPRRRILLLAPRWPWPVHGGDRLRLIRLAEAVAERHDITLLSACQSAAEMHAVVPEGAPFVRVHRIHWPTWRARLQAALGLLGPDPLQAAYYDSPALDRAVETLLPEHDLLWCHLVRMWPHARHAKVPRWVEMTDAISLTMSRAAALYGPWQPMRWLLSLESRRMVRLEREVAQEADLVSVVADLDQRHVAPQAAGNFAVAGNGVDAPVDTGPPLGQRPHHIAMIGRMDSLANRDALWHFVREIMPAVRMRVPAAELQVIGHVAVQDARALQAIPGIRLHGTVPCLSTVLNHCRLGVCPVRLGAGVQNKLLDYMAHGLPAVSSPIGLEGLAARPGHEIVLASDVTDWITAVSGLLCEPEEGSRIGQAGRLMTRQSYQWPACLAKLLDRVDQLLATPPPPVGMRISVGAHPGQPESAAPLPPTGD